MLPVSYQLPAAIVLLIGGIVACFFGYRLFRIVLALFGFFLGAFAAIGQRNIKRLMAYSSIGHMGYALVGRSAGTVEGVHVWPDHKDYFVRFGDDYAVVPEGACEFYDFGNIVVGSMPG